MQKNQIVAVKLVIFSIVNGVLVIYAPDGSLPSRVIPSGHQLEHEIEVLLSACKLSRKSGYLEQLYTTNSDDDAASIEVVYFVLIDSGNASLLPVSSWIPPESDSVSKADKKSSAYAVQRLRWKIEYTNIVYSLLPTNFTLSRLQQVYEAILGKLLDKRNFRKKILSLGMLEDTGRKQSLVRARPATLFRFMYTSLSFVEIL